MKIPSHWDLIKLSQHQGSPSLGMKWLNTLNWENKLHWTLIQQSKAIICMKILKNLMPKNPDLPSILPEETLHITFSETKDLSPPTPWSHNKGSRLSCNPFHRSKETASLKMILMSMKTNKLTNLVSKTYMRINPASKIYMKIIQES